MPVLPHYPLLFSPLRIGPLELRNRLLLSPMTTGFGFLDGAPDERAIAYFSARAGGVGMAVVPFGAVTPEGRVEQRIPWMWRPDAATVMRPLAAAIRERGAIPCLQLGHGGRQVSPRVIGGPPVAPSPVPADAHTHVAPRALTVAQIKDIVHAFGQAAARASEAGFAAVEVHAGHGYLLAQFLSPQSNLRTDEYGGAGVEERARFGAEVIAEVRRQAPELAVLVRLNGTDVVPGGLTPNDAVLAARAFVQAGAQALVVSAGVYGSVPYTIPLLDDPEATFLDSCAFIKERVDVPVIAVGRFSLPGIGEAAIAGGRCDAIAIGRGLLADPDWVAKARAGRIADIRPCIATVQGCAGALQHGGEISCAVNPAVGRETLPPVPRASVAASIVVVGAGPAGLEAARRAAELGHRVVLHERRDRLGGAMELAARTPVLAHLNRLVAWYERQLRELGVEIRLNSHATAEDGIGADLVVIAVGGRTAVPVMEGYDRLPAWTLEDLLDGEPSTLGTPPRPTRPVVAGGGSRALSLALWLAAGGAEPVILSDGPVGADTSGLARRALLTRLTSRGVRVVTGRPVALRDGAVDWVGTDGVPGQLIADGFVAAEPIQPERFDRGELETVVRIGDAHRIGGIPAAIAAGRDTVEAFTRGAGLKTAR